MSLNKLFDSVEKARDTARWRAAFGEPQVSGDRTLIPVARVSYGFGLGFGSGTGPVENEGEPAPGGEGAGGGGGAAVQPLGVLVVTPKRVDFEGTADEGKIALAGIALGALIAYQFFKTLRAIFGR